MIARGDASTTPATATIAEANHLLQIRNGTGETSRDVRDKD